MLLSALLGPAKPPVASRDDVASAQGIYRVQRPTDVLVAQATQGFGQIQIAPGERCLVCLCDYEQDEELRKLTKCTHLFHRECIDEVCPILFWRKVEFRADVYYLQWLTTGRNSCPLCRGQGVDEKSTSRPDVTQPSSATPSTSMS